MRRTDKTENFLRHNARWSIPFTTCGISSGLQQCVQSHEKWVEESLRGDLSWHTFCHPWKYSSRRFLKEDSVRDAREPGQPPGRDCSSRECLGRGLCDEGKIDKKKKQLRDGGRALSHIPKTRCVGPTRVSDAHPLLSSPHHDFCRSPSERRPERTTRTATLGLGPHARCFVVPCVVYSRVPRFHLHNMSTAATRKRKADSDASPSTTSTKAQKSLC